MYCVCMCAACLFVCTQIVRSTSHIKPCAFSASDTYINVLPTYDTHTFKVVSNMPSPKVAITYLNSTKGQLLQMIMIINQTLKYWVALSILYMLLYPPPQENKTTVDNTTRYPLLSSIPMDVYGMQ